MQLYILLGINVCLFVFAFIFPWIYLIAIILFWALLIATIIDAIFLFANQKGLELNRSTVYDKLSNGDENEIFIEVINTYAFKVNASIIDEIPDQFQFRNFLIKKSLEINETYKIKYNLRPTSRGEFHFGSINANVSTLLGLAKRKIISNTPLMMPCYPSFIKLRQFELMAISDKLVDLGIKKMRKIGQSSEFDHIKEYVIGNDIRTINWKATARKNQLMVNYYRDERAQQVYSVIDMGRVMQMPFEEMSLLDYSINAALVLSHISFIKQDKPGLITFSNNLQNFVKADRKGDQLYRIQENLYNAKTNFEESSYESLLTQVRVKLSQRSLFLLYTNFETLAGLKRQLKNIKQINKHHLVVVIIFENTELHNLLTKRPVNTGEIYNQTIAKKFEYEKIQISIELKNAGIQCVYTKPKDLTVNTLNKYLELKARGMI